MYKKDDKLSYQNKVKFHIFIASKGVGLVYQIVSKYLNGCLFSAICYVWLRKLLLDK